MSIPFCKNQRNPVITYIFMARKENYFHNFHYNHYGIEIWKKIGRFSKQRIMVKLPFLFSNYESVTG
jgi:hypothetical protein